MRSVEIKFPHHKVNGEVNSVATCILKIIIYPLWILVRREIGRIILIHLHFINQHHGVIYLLIQSHIFVSITYNIVSCNP